MGKKQDIIFAAQRLFSQFGLKKVTMEDIAREASASKVTVYRYYPDKQAAFEDVVQFEADQLYRAIREAVAAESTVEGKFRAHLVTKIGTIRNLVNFYRVTRDSMNDHWPHIADAASRFMDQETRIVENILKLGNRTGELHVKPVKMTARVMTVSLKSLEFDWAMTSHDIPLERFINRLMDMMLNGLRKR